VLLDANPCVSELLSGTIWLNPLSLDCVEGSDQPVDEPSVLGGEHGSTLFWRAYLADQSRLDHVLKSWLKL